MRAVMMTLEERRASQREATMRYRLRMTPEQRARQAENDRQRYVAMSEERKAASAERRRQRRAAMSPEQKTAMRESARESARERMKQHRAAWAKDHDRLLAEAMESLRERFEAKVEPCPMTGCHLWAGGMGANGYGVFFVAWKSERAHRVAYELYRGEIPRGMHVLHRCDVPLCVNPAHLFIGTNADNTADKVHKGRQPYGGRNATAKLTEEQARAIRERYAAGDVSQRAIARECDVAHVTIQKIVRGQSWRCA